MIRSNCRQYIHNQKWKYEVVEHFRSYILDVDVLVGKIDPWFPAHFKSFPYIFPAKRWNKTNKLFPRLEQGLWRTRYDNSRIHIRIQWFRKIDGSGFNLLKLQSLDFFEPFESGRQFEMISIYLLLRSDAIIKYRNRNGSELLRRVSFFWFDLTSNYSLYIIYLPIIV